jgi:hypothetical protein
MVNVSLGKYFQGGPMRLVKQFLITLALLPMISFANTSSDFADEEALYAADRAYNNVPLLCYAGFRAVIELLPELTNQLNVKAGSTMVVIDNVSTPNGYNTVFEWDVLKSLSPKGVGHYTLHQVYTPGADAKTGALYLNFTTKVPGQIDNIWKIMDKVVNGCADNLPDMPTIPGIPS